MSHLFLSGDPARPVDWRYRVARSRIDRGQFLAPGDADPALRQIWRYLRASKMSSTEASQRRLTERMPSWDLAFRVHEARDNSLRDRLAAYILTGQPATTISEKPPIAHAAITAYAAAFFDVADRLGELGFVLEQVIFSDRKEIIPGGGTLLKLVGYLEGPVALDGLTQRGEGQNVDRFLRTLERESNLLILERTARIMRGLDIRDRRSASELLKMYAHQEAGKKPTEEGPEPWVERVHEMMKMLPIHVRGRVPAGEDHDLAKFEQTAVELTPQEQMLVLTGVPLLHEEELLSVEFPSRPTAAEDTPTSTTFAESAAVVAPRKAEQESSDCHKRPLEQAPEQQEQPQQGRPSTETRPSPGSEGGTSSERIEQSVTQRQNRLDFVRRTDRLRLRHR
jgi:hypothetical protein